MDLAIDDNPTVDELVTLYNSVQWSAYTSDPHALSRAIQQSTFVVTARVVGELVGLARGMSDDVSIFYLQDLLVSPQHQRVGIGRTLLDTCLERFAHVRQKVLLTDGQEHQHRLYRQAGYRDIATIVDVALHAFVLLGNLEPSDDK